MDYFENGIKTLLEMNGFPVFDHIDALSLRCFAFTKEGEPQEWFRPVISVEEAVLRIEKAADLQGYWEIQRYEKGQCLPRRACMVGPIKGSLFLPDLKTYYYHGDTEYFCCKRDDTNTFWMCDFSGVPAVQMGPWELKDILEENIPFLIQMKPWGQKHPPEYRFDYRELLREGLIFHKTCALKEYEETTECERLGSMYVSLQYALMNYGIQMRKMVRFVEAAVGLEEDVKEAIDDLWAWLVRIGLDADIREIPRWEHRIWSVICNHAENKGIVL